MAAPLLGTARSASPSRTFASMEDMPFCATSVFSRPVQFRAKDTKTASKERHIERRKSARRGCRRDALPTRPRAEHGRAAARVLLACLEHVCPRLTCGPVAHECLRPAPRGHMHERLGTSQFFRSDPLRALRRFLSLRLCQNFLAGAATVHHASDTSVGLSARLPAPRSMPLSNPL